jgi:hypothetical protein
MLTEPIASLNVIGPFVTPIAEGSGLLRCEVPALSLGELIELSLSFTGRLPSLHNGSTFLTHYAEQDALLANTAT